MGEIPLFSIIIPVYKIEKYIKECVISVLKQGFSDFEIILVDDGSPDNCPKICDELKDSDTRIKVIHKKNGGVALARKDGAERASGKYIICIDGDDWIDEKCLDKIAKVIDETGADIICHAMAYENGNKMVQSMLPYREGYYSQDDIDREVFPSLIQNEDASYFIPSLCGKAIKKELFLENILANEQVTIGEDGACIIPCVFHANSLYILNECLYCYRYNDESATKGKKVYNWEWPKIVAAHISNKIDIHYEDFEEQLSRKIVHDVFTVVVSQFNRKETYNSIVSDIRNNLDDELYKTAIRQCKFRNSIKAFAMRFVLQKRIFFPIYLYSKVKR